MRYQPTPDEIHKIHARATGPAPSAGHAVEVGTPADTPERLHSAALPVCEDRRYPRWSPHRCGT